MTSVVVACCQLAPVAGANTLNRGRTEAAVRTAVANGASVVVLPELVSSGHVVEDNREAFACAESAEGPTVSSWVRLAAELDVVVVGGFCEVSQGQLFNSAALVDVQGLRAVYRKAHLWDSEVNCFASGDAEPPVVDTRFGRIATMVCYDLDFPEWVRLAALRGAQLLCAPTNWPQGPLAVGAMPMEIVRIQASASVNRLFIAACDRAGSERGMSWVGASTIVDVNGWPLASAWTPGGSIPTITYAACDLERASTKDVGPRNNVHTDRRPSLYHGLVVGPGSRE
ncbi:nitrilase-related carbon-nitrogen hydrolase [Streptomyces sp. NPDC005402]|uniref:nitrilase-related carbon-nitrogen hydrolase n=1 Tax=Streptomyces sp. NPDC005402 TaxID=3155338 RepID=UPI0033AADF3D